MFKINGFFFGFNSLQDEPRTTLRPEFIIHFGNTEYIITVYVSNNNNDNYYARENFNDCGKYGDAYYTAGEHLKHYPDFFFLLGYNTSLLSRGRDPT